MNTEYAVGKIRIRFESRARRRWFVALFYAVLAVWVSATLFLNREETAGAWIVAGCGTLTIALLLFFWSVAGDMNARGNEREMHRREHAHFRAYRILGIFFVGAFFAEFCFRGPNPITPSAPLALRGLLMQLPYALLLATLFLYVSCRRPFCSGPSPTWIPGVNRSTGHGAAPRLLRIHCGALLDSYG